MREKEGTPVSSFAELESKVTLPPPARPLPFLARSPGADEGDTGGGGGRERGRASAAGGLSWLGPRAPPVTGRRVCRRPGPAPPLRSPRRGQK